MAITQLLGPLAGGKAMLSRSHNAEERVGGIMYRGGRRSAGRIELCLQSCVHSRSGGGMQKIKHICFFVYVKVRQNSDLLRLFLINLAVECI